MRNPSLIGKSDFEYDFAKKGGDFHGFGGFSGSGSFRGVKKSKFRGFGGKKVVFSGQKPVFRGLGQKS